MRTLLLLLLPATALAEPLTLGITARLVDATGAPLNAATTATITLSDASETALWQQSQSLSITGGFLSTTLTGDDDSERPLDTALLSTGELWAEVSAPGAESFRYRLLHAPAALRFDGVLVGDATGACEAEGRLMWTPATTTLSACHNGAWQAATE